MSLESVLDTVTEMLRRRRRITYRALQRELGLDDESVAALKVALISVKHVARDEHGAALVWDHSIENAPPERRQITVMFCDLVGSTRLSSAIDPEDLREVMRSYYEECTAAIRTLGGFVAQYQGDGILIYFGYPLANEDDAERAVRAGLSVLQTVRRLDQRLRPRLLTELAARVGIHTGLVIVGGLGDSENPTTMAMGEAPNLAAHIQGVAKPNALLVSHATLAMLPGRFLIEDLGLVALKDPTRPIRLARVLGEMDTTSPRMVRPTLEDPAGHLRRLQEIWARVRDGATATVEIRGAAGLGKTRLADELSANVEGDERPIWTLRCSAFNSQSMFHPITQFLLGRAGVNPDSLGDDALDRLVAALAVDGIDDVAAGPLLGALAGVKLAGNHLGVPDMAPAVLMQSLQALLLAWLRSAARRGPALMVWEDVHWADPSTLVVLKRLLEGTAEAGLLVLITTRPDFTPPWREDVVGGRIVLEPMEADHIRHLIGQIDTGRALAPHLVEEIVTIAEGVPLYAEQIARSVVDFGRGTENVKVPATLHASLMARLDRMGAAKSVAQIAALLGREFSMDLLGAACEMDDAGLLSALEHLTAGDILQQMPDALTTRYTFRHALLQAEAEESLMRTVRQNAHLRIAEVLQQRFQASVDAEPETLARHLTGAGQVRRAIVQWQCAGDHALARSAVREAQSHLEQGMQLLAGLPAGKDRDALELALQIPLASALRALQGVGAPTTGSAYKRASTLAQELDDQHRLLPALNGVYSYHLVSAQYDEAMEPARQLLQVARASGDGMFEMIGLRAVGAVSFHIGDPVTAEVHLERSLSLYQEDRHASMALILGIDHRVMASNFLALTRLVQGRDESAIEIQREALAWAEHLDHAHSIAQALVFYSMLLALLEDWPNVVPIAKRTIEVGVKRGFPVMDSGGRFFLGAARAFTGELDAGLLMMHDSALQWWASGIRNYRPLSEMLLARAHALSGDLGSVRAYLADAHKGIAVTGERWIEAEMWRVRGELIEDEAEADLRRAVAIARAQKSTGFERRALRSLSERGFA